jgi:hypothetical protein
MTNADDEKSYAPGSLPPTIELSATKNKTLLHVDKREGAGRMVILRPFNFLPVAQGLLLADFLGTNPTHQRLNPMAGLSSSPFSVRARKGAVDDDRR